MVTEYRQKAPRKLTGEQRQFKSQKDLEYEMAVHNLSDPFYEKKRTVGVNPGEQEAYTKAKAKLWDDYRNWAIENGLYEVV